MKWIAIITAAFFLTASGLASARGGHYSGGHGSSHKGGSYKNPRTNDHYAKHK